MGRAQIFFEDPLVIYFTRKISLKNCCESNSEISNLRSSSYTRKFRRYIAVSSSTRRISSQVSNESPVSSSFSWNSHDTITSNASISHDLVAGSLQESPITKQVKIREKRRRWGPIDREGGKRAAARLTATSVYRARTISSRFLPRIVIGSRS